MWKLETESAGARGAPTDGDIDAALAEFGRAGGFVILSRAPEDYVQVGESGLEYRRQGRHFRAGGPVGPEKLRQAFHSYFRDDEQWRTLVAWQDVGEALASPRARRSPLGALLGILMLGAAGYIAWRVLTG